jgi:hypothetical protein
MKFLNSAIYILGAIPALYTFSLFTYYLYLEKIVGHIFHNSQPVPFDNQNILVDMIMRFGLAWIFTIIIWLVLSVTLIILTRKNSMWRPILITLLCHLAAILISISGILDWLID